MALSSELSESLHEDGTPLGERAVLAANAFRHAGLYVQGKEELVLQWLASTLADAQFGDACVCEPVCKAAADCLASGRALSIVAVDATAAGSALVQALGGHVASTGAPRPHACLESVVGLLEKPAFHCYVRRKLGPFSSLCRAVLQAVSLEGRADLLLRCVHGILAFHSQDPLKDEFHRVFVEDLLVPLVDAYCSVVGVDADRARYKIQQCVQDIVFCRTGCSAVRACLASLLGSDDDLTDAPPLLFVVLARAAAGQSGVVVARLFSLVLRAFLVVCRNDPGAACGLFVCLCHFVGLQMAADGAAPLLGHKRFKNLFHKDIPKCSKATPSSLFVLKGLLDALVNAEVTADTALGGVSFTAWLEELVVIVVSEVEVGPPTFNVLACVIHLNPLVVEAKMADVLRHTLLVKKQSQHMRATYMSFLKAMLAMFVKLHRLQKFVSKLLPVLKEALDANAECLSSVGVEDILPDSVGSSFGNSLATLPSSHVISMLRSFTYHLVQDCVQPLEENTFGGGMLLYLQVVAQLACTFLSGVRIAEHIVPLPTVGSFIQDFVKFREVLARLGTAMLHREHCRQLVASFLHMCHSCGELQLLLLQYSPVCDGDGASNHGLQVSDCHGDHSATNLHFLHSFLTHEQWSLVTQRITNFGEDSCKALLSQLVLQKLRAVLLLRGDAEPSREVTSAIIKHVVAHVGELWQLLLGPSAAMIVPLLSAEQLQATAQHVVSKLVSTEHRGQSASLLAHPAVSENRLLVVSLSWAALHRISKLLSKRKRKHDDADGLPPLAAHAHLARDVLACVEPRLILHNEDVREKVLQVTPHLAALVNDALAAYTPHPETTDRFSPDADLLEQHLLIIQSLPLFFLSREEQTVVLLCVLSVGISLDAVTAGSKDGLEAVTRLYTRLLLVLVSSPRAPNVASFLHAGRLTRWLLATGYTNPVLLKMVFGGALREGGALAGLEVAIVLLDSAEAKRERRLEALEAATLLLSTLIETKKQLVADTNRPLLSQYKLKLAKAIAYFIKRSGVNEDVQLCSRMVDSFSLALRILRAKERRLAKITPFLEVFVQTALTCLEEEATPPHQLASCTALLGMVLKHKSQLAQVPEDLVPRAWGALSRRHQTQSSAVSLMRLLLNLATQHEFNVIISSLLVTMQVDEEGAGDSSALPTALRLWKFVATAKISIAKLSVREPALLQVCRSAMEAVTGGCGHHSAVPLLELELELSQRRQVQYNMELLDLFLETVANVPLDEPVSLSAFVVLVNTAVALLATLMLQWTVYMMDRIPLYMQAYRHLVAGVVHRADVRHDLPQDDILQVADCAHSIERHSRTLLIQKKDFSRVCVYLIADVMHQFEAFTLYPAVKVHLTNAVYILLQLCDDHAVAHLSEALSPGSRELFKTTYSNYKKYHSFTGRV